MSTVFFWVLFSESSVTVCWPSWSVRLGHFSSQTARQSFGTQQMTQGHFPFRPHIQWLTKTLQCFAELECKAHIFGSSSLIAMTRYLFESYASWLLNECLIMWCEPYLVEISVYLCATPIATFLLLNIWLTNITILQAGTCSLNIEYVLKPCITINGSQIYINSI